MFQNLEIDISGSTLSRKFIGVSLILLICYFWIPLLTIKIVEQNNFYTGLIITRKFLFYQSISSLIFIYFIFLTAKYLKKISKNNIPSKSDLNLNSKIAKTTTTVLCISSIPLIYYLLVGNSSDRVTLYNIIEPIRQNVFFSIVYSIALVSSAIAGQNGNKTPLLFLLLFGVFPELLYGTRVSVFRMLFLLAVIINWNQKALFYGGIIFTLIGLSRSLFNQYSRESLYDYSILFLGDPLNILLGSSKLLSLENIKCGVDGMHAFRPFSFPLGIRSYFEPYLGDLVFCMRDHGISGLGNTITNELYLAPLSLILSLLTLSIIYFLLGYYRINNLIQTYFILLVISALPYIVRNGMIATVNHLITILVWGLTPLFLLIKRNNGTNKIRNN